MTIAVKWRAKKWHNAPLLCRIFGHRWTAGWWGSDPYLRTSNAVWDNLDELHIDLTCQCDHCGQRHTMARIHASSIMREVTEHQKRGFFLHRFKVEEKDV